MSRREPSAMGPPPVPSQAGSHTEDDVRKKYGSLKRRHVDVEQACFVAAA
jgi:hypothetical protein